MVKLAVNHAFVCWMDQTFTLEIDDLQFFNAIAVGQG